MLTQTHLGFQLLSVNREARKAAEITWNHSSVTGSQAAGRFRTKRGLQCDVTEHRVLSEFRSWEASCNWHLCFDFLFVRACAGFRFVAFFEIVLKFSVQVGVGKDVCYTTNKSVEKMYKNKLFYRNLKLYLI